MLRSVLALVVRRVIALLMWPNEDAKDLEIVVLRHQLNVLRRQVGRPRFRWGDRLVLAAISRFLPRDTWRAFLVTPQTVLRWHRELVRRKWSWRSQRPAGRPPLNAATRALILKLARENPRWGYQRIRGELVKLGPRVSATAIRSLLRHQGQGPAPRPGRTTWRAFLRQQAASIIACDFFTVETVGLKTLSVLFFIELGSRRVHLGGCTANPDAAWVTQQARNFAVTMPEDGAPFRFLVRDRDSKFTRAFDHVFRSEGIRTLRTPVRAPRANAYAERWVRTVRTECLDWLLILSRRHLERVLHVYVGHYNHHRPHRGLALAPPEPRPQREPVGSTVAAHVRRRDLLGGLLHEYYQAAA
jgi:putative transposase